MHKPKFEFFLFSFANLLGNFVLALFVSFAFPFMSCFVARLIVFLSYVIVAG